VFIRKLLEEKKKKQFLLVVLMSGPDYQAKCINSSDIVTILAAEGVQFLLSGEGKVILLLFFFSFFSFFY
jgi:hypothetical protein